MTTEFVADPLVPLELTLGIGKRYTLYQPGWYTADDGSAGFLGSNKQLYGFTSLEDLVEFVDSGAANDLTPSPHFKSLRIWTTEEYARRLCVYDLTRLPEIADGELSADEQAGLGSTLALMLDLLDYMDVETSASQALHDDEDISKLASGDELLSVFRAAHHRHHVVELLDANWSDCVSEVSRRVVTPKLPEGPAGRGTAGAGGGPGATLAGVRGAVNGTAPSDGPVPLEDAAPALTLWFGLADEGFYALRGTALTDGHPAYLGTPAPDGARLAVWTDVDRMQAEVAQGSTGELPGLDLVAVAARDDVSFTPHDDNIFDLVELADSVSKEMDADAADRLVSAWSEVLRLAAWGGWRDVTELLGPDSPAGAFMVACALDLAQDRPGAAQALATVDTEAAAAGWLAVVPALTARLDQRS
ncbi:hypothetical protein [Actinopolymorpha singaporensis]|uniref:Uncharacterized protein n=1 Tax=Actinopolymorpha singaporensis TaxID=117157 RepID=A0A1H1SMN4_9ACTN|nr:hypothetical protein [Actinopolymorpha singaporensis]SDS49267.1 hypothetical protein SAMN04489717_2866 [Actinopolymorpha singaporensis]